MFKYTDWDGWYAIQRFLESVPHFDLKRMFTRVRACVYVCVGVQAREQSARDLCEIMRFGCVIRARPINTDGCRRPLAHVLRPTLLSRSRVIAPTIGGDPDQFLLFS